MSDLAKYLHQQGVNAIGAFDALVGQHVSEDPRMGTGWRPGRGVVGRARDRLAPKAAQWLLARTLPRMNAALTGCGQPPIREFFEVLDRCSRVLVMTSPSFDFPPARLPDNVWYVGPQLDDPVWTAGQTWGRPGSEPLVLVATSSIFQHQTGLLQRRAQGLRTLPVARSPPVWP